MKTSTTLVAGALAAAAILTLAPRAEAQLIIKNPKDHPPYVAELEPHLDVSPWGRDYGYGYYGGYGLHGAGVDLGGGFRATIKIADPVIPKLNNSIGITFGLDVTNCSFCNRSWSLWTPVGANWTFYLTREWSVFADLGFMLRSDGFYEHAFADIFGELGGRWHFSDKASLTMRIGYPFVSVGVSFFVG
jgi:hypothetical protein